MDRALAKRRAVRLHTSRMHRSSLAFVLLAPLALFACNKSAEEGADAKSNAKAGTTDGAKQGGDGAGTAGSDDAPAAAQTCPAKLEGDVVGDVLITKDCGDVIIEGSVYVYSTLTLEAGARLVATDSAQLVVGAWDKPGKLITKGTSEAPVVITSKGDKAPGVWGGVSLEGAAARSQIDGLVLEYAGAGEVAALQVAAADVTIGSLTVRNSKGPAVDLTVESSAALASLSVEKVGVPALRTTAAAASGVVAVAGEGAEAHIVTGNFARDSKLAAIGVPWVITYDAAIEGEESSAAVLTVAAGAKLRFTESGALTVGRYNTGKLVLAGEAGKELELGSARGAQADAWRGLEVGSKGTLEAKHVKLGDAGRDQAAAIELTDTCTASLSNLAISNSSTGVRVTSSNTKLTLANSSFTAVPVAIEAHPVTFAGVGAGNSYDAQSRIVLIDGTVESPIAWTAQPTVVELRGNLSVDNKGKLTVAGGKFQVADGVTIDVGTYDTATLELKGTATAPVEIAATRDEPQLWGPISFHGRATASVLEHVLLRSVGGAAGVVVEDEAVVKIDDLRCDRCAATVQWSCAAKLEKANVSAGAETASAELAPEGC